MVRIGISVEGGTEERFVKSVLAPYLYLKGIHLVPVDMGGKVNIDRAKNELKKLANNFNFVTTYYDFYAFQKKVTGETKESLEARLKNAVHDSVKSKLVPYIQMYEFEGILFSCPESMQRQLNEADVQQWAQAILDEHAGNPELINNSEHTAPSKRLINNTGYRKTTHGPNIAGEIGIDKIRQSCPGFNSWLATLEALI